MCDPERIASFANGDLSPGDAKEARAHLVACDRCRKTLDAMRDTDPDSAPPRLIGRRAVAAELRNLQARFAADSEVGVTLIPQLLSQSADTWRAVASSDLRLRTPGVVRGIVDLVDATYSELPVRAVELAGLAADIADMVSESDDAWRVRALAWRKFGSALGSRGELKDAERAFDVAESCIRDHWPDRELEEAMLQNARVPVLRLMGRTSAARRRLASVKAAFIKFEQTKQLAYAIYNEASLDYSDGDYNAARSSFTEAAQRMRFLAEQHMEALCYHAIGQCASRLGDDDAAVQQWARAKVLFCRAGMHAERARVTQSIGRLRIANGDIAGGLADIREAEMIFDEFAMRLDAIDASLEIVETMIGNAIDDEEVLQRCRRAVTRSERAGLGVQSAMALAYLRRIAADGSLDIEYVRHVRQFIRDAHTNPGAEFHPPIRNLR